LLDQFGAVSLWNQIFQFHTPQLYRGWLDIGCPRLKIFSAHFLAQFPHHS
jgi:lipid-A-disaccharide synthase-like uncharacterized protein